MQRTAVITGGSRGLGLALATALLSQSWTVVLTARSASDLERVRAALASPHVYILAGDIGDTLHRAQIARLAQTLGGVDAVVNNASTLGISPLPALLDYPIEALAEVVGVNALAPLALVQTLLPALRPGARIVNISSDAAVEAYPGWGGYGASKAMLEQLSAVLAVELPDYRVYWVDPGDMRTEMHQAAFPGEDIGDRPLPDASVPGLVDLLQGDRPSGRYQARALPALTRV